MLLELLLLRIVNYSLVHLLKPRLDQKRSLLVCTACVIISRLLVGISLLRQIQSILIKSGRILENWERLETLSCWQLCVPYLVFTS